MFLHVILEEMICKADKITLTNLDKVVKDVTKRTTLIKQDKNESRGCNNKVPTTTMEELHLS